MLYFYAHSGRHRLFMYVNLGHFRSFNTQANNSGAYVLPWMNDIHIDLYDYRYNSCNSIDTSIVLKNIIYADAYRL